MGVESYGESRASEKIILRKAGKILPAFPKVFLGLSPGVLAASTAANRDDGASLIRLFGANLLLTVVSLLGR
jgi:hypothetical protein